MYGDLDLEVDLLDKDDASEFCCVKWLPLADSGCCILC